ncbi:dihydroxyacetone kinase subunit L [Soehngenia longivitae]|uniref:phosphoenolpyruvate--glycerone phosphotransferase n=1 Tax=Soehngenia longivitae TaxID=2562294 RepID=A0A4Z0D8A2_9FIRM|nr:dihydroxyacetone kinase subunit DhaL [Soehngenia longivitae]TFZ41144.1 dihydroxyacetone kinase subunit L [Soehngenia longivitae]
MEKTVYSYIKAMRDIIVENKDFLTQLDAEIGDADHGTNMARGFNAVVEKLSEEDLDLKNVLKKAGMGLISSVGGASGPLYGTMFLKAANVAVDNTMDPNVLCQMFKAALDGVKERGKATKGEKTIIDAMEPAYEAFVEVIDSGGSVQQALEKALEAAKEGVEYTKTIIATKGRASYLGERSIGHQDPGATSFTLLLESILKNYMK